MPVVSTRRNGWEVEITPPVPEDDDPGLKVKIAPLGEADVTECAQMLRPYLEDDEETGKSTLSDELINQAPGDAVKAMARICAVGVMGVSGLLDEERNPIRYPREFKQRYHYFTQYFQIGWIAQAAAAVLAKNTLTEGDRQG